VRQLRICLSLFEKKKTQSRQERRRTRSRETKGDRLRERERKSSSILCPAAMEDARDFSAPRSTPEQYTDIDDINIDDDNNNN